MIDYKNINKEIKKIDNTNDISDGYHTFGELYEHRIQLFITLCRVVWGHEAEYKDGSVWRSLYHSDGSKIEGWFILGMSQKKGNQITYHIPIDRWKDCRFADILKRAPEFDGHTSEDVLKRVKKI